MFLEKTTFSETKKIQCLFFLLVIKTNERKKKDPGHRDMVTSLGKDQKFESTRETLSDFQPRNDIKLFGGY